MPYADPDKKRTNARAYREANKPKIRAAQKRCVVAKAEKYRARKRQWQRTQRGMLDAPAEQKAGTCDICKRASPLVCDHDHATGKFRGWLCVGCNVKLRALDDRAWFERAEAYRVQNQ
jgi:hypothetical protein